MKRWMICLCVLMCGCACERQHKFAVSTEIQELHYARPLESQTALKFQYECSWKN